MEERAGKRPDRLDERVPVDGERERFAHPRVVERLEPHVGNEVDEGRRRTAQFGYALNAAQALQHRFVREEEAAIDAPAQQCGTALDLAADREELNLVEVWRPAEILVEAGQLVDLAVDRLGQPERAGPDDLPLHPLPLLIERLGHLLGMMTLIRVADQEREVGLRLRRDAPRRSRTARLDALTLPSRPLRGLTMPRGGLRTRSRL